MCCIPDLLRNSKLVWVSVTKDPAMVFFVNYSYIEKQVATASSGFCFLVVLVLFVSASDIVSEINALCRKNVSRTRQLRELHGFRVNLMIPLLSPEQAVTFV